MPPHFPPVSPVLPKVAAQNVIDLTAYDTWEAVLSAVSAHKGIADFVVSSWGRVRIRSRREYRLTQLQPGLFTEDRWREFCEMATGSARRASGTDEWELDTGANIGGARFRVSRVAALGGVEFTLRALPKVIPSPDEARVPLRLLKEFLALDCSGREPGGRERPRGGLVLVSGATGHGKSTTIAAMIGALGRSRPMRIVTIEDPVEYVHEDPPNGTTYTYREVGVHTKSFADALRAVLRMNPDVIVVGEIRDAETADIAVGAALTGHLVVSTIHGGSVAEAAQRLKDIAEEAGSSALCGVAMGLRLIVAQRLIAATGPSAPPGGVVPIHEILVNTSAVASKLRDEKINALHQEIDSGAQFGMQSFESAIKALRAERVLL